jgi:hypothetical protein
MDKTVELTAMAVPADSFEIIFYIQFEKSIDPECFISTFPGIGQRNLAWPDRHNYVLQCFKPHKYALSRFATNIITSCIE